MPIDDDKSPAGETAQQIADRKWTNNEISKRHREKFKIARDTPKQEPEIRNAKIITNDDDDVKHKSATRLDTVKDLRAKIKFLQDVIKSGPTYTIVALDDSIKRQEIIAAYRFSIRQQRGRLAREKLRRLNAGTWKLTKAAQPESSS